MTTWREEMLGRIGERYGEGDRFTIEDVYSWEEEMKALYPNNRHVRETMRDILQDFRDDGLIRFDDFEGTYLVLEEPKPKAS